MLQTQCQQDKSDQKKKTVFSKELAGRFVGGDLEELLSSSKMRIKIDKDNFFQHYSAFNYKALNPL